MQDARPICGWTCSPFGRGKSGTKVLCLSGPVAYTTARRRGITNDERRKEGRNSSTRRLARERRKVAPVLILREVISFLSLSSLSHPSSFLPPPLRPSHSTPRFPLCHRWLSARWPKIGSTITREFAVWLDRPFSGGSCLSSGYKRVSPVTNAVVPTTIPFTSELFSSCRCAVNREPRYEPSKIDHFMRPILRAAIFLV